LSNQAFSCFKTFVSFLFFNYMLWMKFWSYGHGTNAYVAILRCIPLPSFACYAVCKYFLSFSSKSPAASIWFEVWGVVNPVPEMFDSNRKKFRFSRIFLIFQAKNSDDLFVFFFSPQLKKLKKLAFLRKYSPFTPTFLKNFSFFLIKKTILSKFFSFSYKKHVF